jgi:hypothetical protein
MDVAYAQQENRTPTHGYEPSCEAAMQAFARGWASRQRERWSH